MKTLIFVFATIGSYVGWAIAEYFGGDILVSFLVSSLFSGFGIYVGWRIANEWLE